MRTSKTVEFLFYSSLVLMVAYVWSQYFISKRASNQIKMFETRAKDAEAKAKKLEQEHKKAQEEVTKQAGIIAKVEVQVTESKKRFENLNTKYEALRNMPPTPPECVEAVKPYQIALAQADAVIDSAKHTIARLEVVSTEKDKQIFNLTVDNKRLEEMSKQNAIAATSYKAALESEKSNLWKVRFKSFSIGFGTGFLAGLATGRQ